MDIAEFLLARIAEDEAWARDAWAEQSHAGGCDTCGAAFPRVLAECEAKRLLIALTQQFWDDPKWDAYGAEGLYEDVILKHLALPYADHSDYDAEWKP